MPITPPQVLAATSSAWLVPICVAVIACRWANRVLLLTTDPVMNTPSQPIAGAISGNTLPLSATLSPMLDEAPEKLAM